MFVKYDYQPLLEDFYGDGNLRIETIFKILVNAGNFHSDMVGDNLLQGTLNGYAWVVTDWYGVFEKTPKYGDKISVKTWIHVGNSVFGGDRNSEIYANGEFCGKAVQKLVLIDINTNRPAKIGQDIMRKYEPENETVFSEKVLPRILMPENYESEVKLRPRRNDIDYNHHVHNVYYFDYAMEALPEDIYRKHDFNKIRIKYILPIREGENLTVKYAKINERNVVGIFGSEGKLMTVMEM